MKQTSEITKYINDIIQNNKHKFWRDEIFNYFVKSYLSSSYCNDKGYLHYNGNVYKCHLWFGEICAVDEGHTSIASFSPKKFKAYCRRLNKIVKKV